MYATDRTPFFNFNETGIGYDVAQGTQGRGTILMRSAEKLKQIVHFVGTEKR